MPGRLISSTDLATGAGSGTAVTASSPLINWTQTWNAGAVPFTLLRFNAVDTASAAGSLLFDLQVGGASKFSIDKTGLVQSGAVFSSGAVRSVSNSGLLSIGSSSDVILARDAANTLALRNGTAAQTFNVYNTYTDASNYERGVFDWASSANTLRIGTEAAGTGSARSLEFVTGGTGRWFIQAGGNLLASTDNTYDIGANGASRPRDIYLGRNMVLPTTGQVYWSGRGSQTAQGDGVFRLANNASTSTTDITLSGASGSGGSTATFGGNLASGGAVIAAATGYLGFSTRNLILSPADGTTRLSNWAGTITTDITLSGASGSGGSAASFGGALTASGYVKSQSTTVAGLTAAATAGEGARSFVTDANATMAAGIGTVVVGGGSNKVPVYSDGTDWLIG